MAPTPEADVPKTLATLPCAALDTGRPTRGDIPVLARLVAPMATRPRARGATLPYPARLTPGDTAVLGEPIDFGAGGVKLQLVRRERRVPGPERRGRDAAVAELY
jgi:hypothetical protein